MYRKVKALRRFWYQGVEVIIIYSNWPLSYLPNNGFPCFDHFSFPKVRASQANKIMFFDILFAKTIDIVNFIAGIRSIWNKTIFYSFCLIKHTIEQCTSTDNRPMKIWQIELLGFSMNGIYYTWSKFNCLSVFSFGVSGGGGGGDRNDPLALTFQEAP